MVPPHQPTSTSSTIPICSDSGTTDTLIRFGDSDVVTHITPCSEFRVRVANNQVVASTHVGRIPIPHLPGKYITAHLFEDTDLSKSLLSISELCNDHDCEATFTKTTVLIRHDKSIIFSGTKEPHAKLWNIDLSVPTPSSDATAMWSVKLNVDAEVVNWWHAVMGYPPVSTFLRFLSWCEIPRLTAAMVRANPPNPQATAIGHLNQTRKNQRSSKPRFIPPITTSSVTFADDPTEQPIDFIDPAANTASVYTKIMTTSEIVASGILHSDLTGAFPWAGCNGERYWLVSVFENYIHIEFMKSKSAADYVEGYTKTYAFFEARGCKVQFHRMDNETSDQVERLAEARHLSIQYVPVGTHRRNKAERAIQDAKNQFLSMFWGVPDDFPTDRWPQIRKMLLLTLNLLRPHALNPTISAYEGIFKAKFDFKAHTLAPFGMPTTVHEKPHLRASWDGHGVPGFFLHHERNNYRSAKFYIPETNGVRSSDSFAFHPEPLCLPGSNDFDMLRASITDLIDRLHEHEGRYANVPKHTAHQLTAVLQDYRDQYRSAISPAASVNPQPIHTPATEHPPPPPVQALPQGDTHGRQIRSPKSQWQVTQRHKVPTRQQRYFDRSGQSFFDTATKETFKILGVYLCLDRTLGVGPKTLSYRYVDVAKHPDDSQNTLAEQQYEHTRCAELLNDSHITWDNEASYPANAAALSVSRELYDDIATDMLYELWRDDNNAHEQAHAAINCQPDGKPITRRSVMAGEYKNDWARSASDEWRKLLRIKQAVKPIHRAAQPSHKRTQTGRYNPQLKEKLMADGSTQRRTRGTVSGNDIECTTYTSTNTAAQADLRILYNGVVSTQGGKFMTLDIDDFYLNHDIDTPEYMWVNIKDIPEDIMTEFDLLQYVDGNRILMEILKGLYGLKQAGKLANDALVPCLEADGFMQAPLSPGIFKHATNGVAFALVVDDFGVSYTDTAGPEALMRTLTTAGYTFKSDWSGAKFLGQQVRHDRERHEIRLSMPDHIPRILARFRPTGTRQAKSPGIYHSVKYGMRGPQLVTHDTSPAVSPSVDKESGQILGCIGYYAQNQDATMLTVTNRCKSSPRTEALAAQVEQLLEYASTHPNNEVVLRRSNMRLIAHSDGSHLSAPGARGVLGGIGFMGNDDDDFTIYGTVYAFSRNTDCVTASTSETEYAALYTNGQELHHSRDTLEFLGWNQAATTIVCDNECAMNLANNTIKIKRSKSIDTRFHWIRDRVKQGMFYVKWAPGHVNLADFFTKVIPSKEHQQRMWFYVQAPLQREATSALAVKLFSRHCSYTPDRPRRMANTCVFSFRNTSRSC